MQSRSAYEQYKHHSSVVVQWLVKSSNAILLHNPHHAGLPPLDDPSREGLSINRTGEVKVNDIVAMASLISQYVKRVPSAIFTALHSAIILRTASYNRFSSMVDLNPSSLKSNASHKHFIETLQRTFDELGGADWTSRLAAGGEVSEEEPESTFANRFQSLHVESGESGGEEDSTLELFASAQRRPRARGKYGKKGKGKKRNKAQRFADIPEDLPLESYKIIQDEDGVIVDYLMAVLDLIQEWVDLRVFVQDLWKEVAYDGLHSAVAGALSNMTVTAIRNAESAVWLEFPGHDSYFSVLEVLTNGDLEGAKRGIFKLDTWDAASRATDIVDIDVGEQLMLHAYHDLLNFAVDYQNNRNGRPTKRMQKQLAAWDPSLDLLGATREERLVWRRKYTINWLYDLVNVYADPILQDSTQQQRLEDIDWSSDGHWSKKRRLFGLNDFAGFVCSLAMQKPGTNIRSRIRPSHVFQLQCIVDSMTAAHGWTTGFVHGDVLRCPAADFKATRDIDMFLERDGVLSGKSYPLGVSIVKQVIQRLVDPEVHRDSLLDIMEITANDFLQWLGRSPFDVTDGLSQPSRFAPTNTQGFHEYSPYLCGVGLVEGLELAAQMGMHLWDNLPEMIFTIHIHNMLVQSGFLEKPIGLFQIVQDMYPTAFFKDGKPPTRNYINALLERTGADRRELPIQTQRQRQRNNQQLNNMQLDKFFNAEKNKFFKTNTLLTACHAAEWDLERIADKDVAPNSMLGVLRAKRAGKEPAFDIELLQQVKDESTGEVREEVCKLDDVLNEDQQRVPQDVLGLGIRAVELPGAPTQRSGMSTSRTLDIFKADLIQDVCGVRRPLSSMNHALLYCSFVHLFQRFELRLRKENHAGYRRVMSNAGNKDTRRLALCSLALEGRDERVCKIMAEELEANDNRFLLFSYWDDVEREEFRDFGQERTNDGCVIV